MLGTHRKPFLHSGIVVNLLRFAGIVNAAIWFGGLIFFTFFAGPAFFSAEMMAVFSGSKPHAGAAAQVLIGKFFLLQQWCAGLAIAHLIGEWLYSGRPFQKFTLILLMVLFTTGIIGGHVLLPKMRDLHIKKYAMNIAPDVREASAKSMSILHGTSRAINVLVIAGVLVYLWQVTNTPSSARFTSINKFKT